MALIVPALAKTRKLLPDLISLATGLTENDTLRAAKLRELLEALLRSGVNRW